MMIDPIGELSTFAIAARVLGRFLRGDEIDADELRAAAKRLREGVPRQGDAAAIEMLTIAGYAETIAAVGRFAIEKRSEIREANPDIKESEDKLAERYLRYADEAEQTARALGADLDAMIDQEQANRGNRRG